jgi:hypothetical protein
MKSGVFKFVTAFVIFLIAPAAYLVLLSCKPELDQPMSERNMVVTHFIECNDSRDSTTYRCVEWVSIYGDGYIIVYTNNGVAITQVRH